MRRRIIARAGAEIALALSMRMATACATYAKATETLALVSSMPTTMAYATITARVPAVRVLAVDAAIMEMAPVVTVA